jgi:hypothetical protein
MRRKEGSPAFSEIVPPDRLLSRAHEIADQIIKLPPLTVSYTRLVLTQKLRACVDDTVAVGLALEGISAADVARMAALLCEDLRDETLCRQRVEQARG